MTSILDQFRLDGKTAIITGGAGYLGQKFCRALLDAGASVVAADLPGSKLNEQLLPASQKLLLVESDIKDKNSLSNLVNQCLQQFGTIDILVNNAAIDPKLDTRDGALSTNFEDYPLEAWQSALDVNLTGMFLSSQAVTPTMLQQGGGCIINISSIYGLVAPDQRLYQQADGSFRTKPAFYSVTKAGVIGFTKYLAAYFAGKNIRVNALSPGGIQRDHSSDFVERYSARTILGRMGQPDEMNGALLFLASPASKYMTGSNLVVDGGWSTW